MSRFLVPPPTTTVVPGAKPTFSVIVAAYQAADTIAEAIESALAQTLAPHEVIVCDDGSTDELMAALAPFGERIQVLRQDNRGEAAAKNAAARAASAEFVVILDADDVFMPERLERMAELAAARPDLDIITTDAVLELDGEPLRRCYTSSFTFPIHDQEREILRRNFVFGLAAVRRDRLLEDGGFNESVRFTTDWERWLRLVLSGSRVGLCTQALARYRLQPGSLSAQRSRMLEGRLATLTLALANDVLDEKGRTIVNATIGAYERELLVTRMREALVAGDGRARRYALDAMRERSLSPRTRAKAAISALAPRLADALSPGSLARRPREYCFRRNEHLLDSPRGCGATRWRTPARAAPAYSARCS